MATAKRVKQDGKYERVQTVIERTYDINYRENGVIVKNYPVPSVTERVEVSQSRFVPQPDRIVLDLSIEEARLVETVVGKTPYGMGLTPVYNALGDALYSTQGTSPSKAQDTASSGTVTGRYPSSIDR